MAKHSCNYTECVPCFREWVKFIQTRQNQSARVPGTNIRVKISEQTSIKPETPAQGYRMVFSRDPACQRVIEKRDEIESSCDPKPGSEARVASILETVNNQLQAKRCGDAARTVERAKRHVVCHPKR